MLRLRSGASSHFLCWWPLFFLFAQHGEDAHNGPSPQQAADSKDTSPAAASAERLGPDGARSFSGNGEFGGSTDAIPLAPVTSGHDAVVVQMPTSSLQSPAPAVEESQI